jgi:hypothetical protein
MMSGGVGVVVTILTLGFCYILYSIRYLRPLAYGMAEIVIGMWLVVAALIGAPPGVPDEPTLWAIVGKSAAGIYIIVRGLNNMSQSRFVAGNDRARWFFEGRWGGSGTRRRYRRRPCRPLARAQRIAIVVDSVAEEPDQGGSLVFGEVTVHQRYVVIASGLTSSETGAPRSLLLPPAEPFRHGLSVRPGSSFASVPRPHPIVPA